MPYIPDRGSPNSDIWFIVDRPFAGDIPKGYLFSSGLGYMWDKFLKEIGVHNYYVCSVFPDTDHPHAARNIIAHVDSYHPRIIIPLDASGRHFDSRLIPSRKKKDYNEEEDSEIFKYAGSILTCDSLKYPHYMIPTIGPELLARQYKLKDQVQLDIMKGVSELEFFKKNHALEPLPQRELKFEFSCFEEELEIIKSFLNYKYISNDIETIYPKKGSSYYDPRLGGPTHPGYPITIGLAPSPYYGISISAFREKTSETIELWRLLDRLFRNTIQIGQNFFSFDLCFYEALGFRFDTRLIEDTMIRHHVLWPELPHKLQHLTRQYTRETYYKDEGFGWNMKDMRKLKRYNCLDVCVTYEVFLAQEEEFNERPQLR